MTEEYEKCAEALEDLYDEENIEYIEFDVPETALQVLTESNWLNSGVKDFEYRIDPSRPEMNQKRHVHIARKRHLRSGAQFSWDIEGFRHDSSRFPNQTPKAAKNIARRVLKLADSVIIENMRY